MKKEEVKEWREEREVKRRRRREEHRKTCDQPPGEGLTSAAGQMC